MGPLALVRDGAPDAQKNELKPWQKQAWCIPAVSAEFVAAMEDVRDLYEEPYDPQRPKVNFDETSQQLIAETRPPSPLQPGQPERYDYEYKRNGTRNLFLICEPQVGWRHMAVTAQRTMKDVGHQMPWLVDERYPDADVVRVVMDNLNTHKPASLYETFEPAEARRILKRLEFHYTPKHGSWLNMAEIEWSVLSRQCLDRRIPDEETLKREIHTSAEKRHAAKTTIEWRFTSRDARVKLHRLYPSTSS
jgi:hypothetical protein